MARPGKNMNKRKSVTPKFKELVKEFMKEHEDVLKELAKR